MRYRILEGSVGVEIKKHTPEQILLTGLALRCYEETLPLIFLSVYDKYPDYDPGAEGPYGQDYFFYESDGFGWISFEVRDTLFEYCVPPHHYKIKDHEDN